MSTSQTPECSVCGGREIATGKKQKREEGKVYYEMQCTECKSIGWEWKKEWDVMLLSKRMVVPLFMFCGFAGGISLIFASLFIPGFFGDGSWMYLFIFTLAGVAIVWFGLRPRVVIFHPDSREIEIGWGVRWTWKLKTIGPDEWVGLNVEKFLPVVVYPHYVSHLPPRWKLSAIRQNQAKVILADYPTEQAASKARDFFAQQFKLKL